MLKKFKEMIILFIFGIVIGIIIRVIGLVYFDQGLILTEGKFLGLADFYIFLIIVVLGYMIHIIIHEAGHLIFGLISGYSFVSFRIASLTLIREGGRFKLKKYNIPGTAGQCLMMPPKIKNESFPFILYNLGGGLLNLIVALASIILATRLGNLHLFRAILIFSSLGGIIGALTNIIPMKISGIANDGYNILSMLKDKNSRHGFYTQLRVHGLQSQGVRIRDLPLGDFQLEEGEDLTNPLNTSIILMQHNWYMDNMDFQGANKALERLEGNIEKLIGLYRYEVNIERIFLELIGDNDRNFIDSLYNDEVKKYIKMSKYMIGKKRFLMAYEAFYNDDRAKALEYFDEINTMKGKYPVKGEADMEVMLAQYIRDRIKE